MFSIEKSFGKSFNVQYRQAQLIQVEFCPTCRTWNCFQKTAPDFEPFLLIHIKKQNPVGNILLSSALKGTLHHKLPFLRQFKWHSAECKATEFETISYILNAKSLDFKIRNKKDSLIVFESFVYNFDTFLESQEGMLKKCVQPKTLVVTCIILQNLKNDKKAVVSPSSLSLIFENKQTLFKTKEELLFELWSNNFSNEEKRLVGKPIYVRFIDTQFFQMQDKLKFWKRAIPKDQLILPSQIPNVEVDFFLKFISFI